MTFMALNFLHLGHLPENIRFKTFIANHNITMIKSMFGDESECGVCSELLLFIWEFVFSEFFIVEFAPTLFEGNDCSLVVTPPTIMVS